MGTEILVPLSAAGLYVIFEVLRRRFRRKREAREREEVLQLLESSASFSGDERQAVIRALSLWNNGLFRETSERRDRFQAVLKRRREEMVRLVGVYVETLRSTPDEQGEPYLLGRILMEVLSHAYLELNDQSFFDGVYRYLEAECSELVWWELLDGTLVGRDYGPGLSHYKTVRHYWDSLPNNAPAITDAMVQEQLTQWSHRVA